MAKLERTKTDTIAAISLARFKSVAPDFFFRLIDSLCAAAVFPGHRLPHGAMLAAFCRNEKAYTIEWHLAQPALLLVGTGIRHKQIQPNK
jgi:hypothetical protein